MQTVMPYLVDGILLFLFVSIVIRAARIGLARALAGIIAWVAAAALALQFCAPIAEAVYTQFVQSRLTQAVQQEITDRTDAIDTVEITNALLGEIPEGVLQTAESVGVDVDALRERMVTFSPSAGDYAQQIEAQILRPIAVAAIRVIMFLLILAAVTVVLQLLLRPIGKALHKLPAIGTADRALGGVLGILKGAVAVAVLAILAKIAADVIGGRFAEAVSYSRIIPFIENSPFAEKFFRA